MFRDAVWKRGVIGRERKVQVGIRKIQVLSRGQCDRLEKGGRGGWEADLGIKTNG